MKTIHAIYENGVFRPFEAIELPVGCEVEFEPRIVVEGDARRAARKRARALLSILFDTADPEFSERHDEVPT